MPTKCRCNAPARCGRSEDKAPSTAVPALVRLLQDSDGVGFAEFRQSAVARVGVGFDVEQIENRESLAFDGQMVPLDALA